MFKQIIFTALAVAGLTGCASIVNGTSQSVAVHTSPIAGASCTLENDKGKWMLPHTPGTVTVNRSYNDLQINCDKPGYRSTYKQIASKTKGMVFGNAVFGGAIGAGIDIVDGAAYDYPNDIYVSMHRGIA